MLDLIARRGRETLLGGEVVARMLAAEGVERVFGIVDGSYFGLCTSLRKCGIELVSPRHETSAVHAAAAYARLTGRLGVCMASNGPGVANALPGVAVENAEGNRVLLITSARREGTIAPDRGGTYQSFPQVETTAAMAKWSCRVPSFGRLQEIVRRALRVSWSGRPGVVHVDIPESVLNGKFDLGPGWLWEPRRYRPLAPISPDPDLVEEAAELLVRARAPMIHAGSGVVHARAYEELAAVAEALHAPVTTSWGARAAVDERFGYAVPMIYVDLVREVRCESDVALVLGSRIGETDWWGKPPYWAPPARLRTIQVDIDEETIGNNRPADLGIVADVRAFLRRLREAIAARKDAIDVAARRARLARVQDARAGARAALDRKLADHAAPMCSAHVPAVCRRVFPDDAIAVFDGGNACVWANFYHEARAPGTVLSTPKFGMLGAGLAQAIGAKVAFPERHVYLVTGDGAFGFHPQEIETAVRHRLPIVTLILCDGQWGMVKMSQSFMLRPIKTLLRGSLAPEETVGTDFAEVRWDVVARGMGAHGERVSAPGDLEPAIRRALAQPGPSVIHVDVDPVKHMWAPGLRAFKEMHAEPRGA